MHPKEILLELLPSGMEISIHEHQDGMSLSGGRFPDVFQPTESEENLIVDVTRRMLSSGFCKRPSYDVTCIRFYIMQMADSSKKLLLELLHVGLGISMYFCLSSAQEMEPIKVYCLIIT